MSTWTPDVTEHEMWLTLIVQGFAIGLVFNPMTVMAYTTLSTQLRGEGTAMQSLARNIGSAIGISVTSFTLTRSDAGDARRHRRRHHAVRPGAAEAATRCRACWTRRRGTARRCWTRWSTSRRRSSPTTTISG